MTGVPGVQPDLELRLMLALTRRLPAHPMCRKISSGLRRLYVRKARPDVVAELFGLKMLLAPSEVVEGALLFHPQMYDAEEIAALSSHLKPGDTFLDLGANVGLYSLLASRWVGNAGRVIAIEADPDTFEVLQTNLRQNGANNVTAVNVGVADRSAELAFGRNQRGNRGGNSFAKEGDESILVRCEPLTSILRRHGVMRVAAAKLDIEGYEVPVLSTFLKEARRNDFPRLLILERNPRLVPVYGDPLPLLERAGYCVKQDLGLNLILELPVEEDA